MQEWRNEQQFGFNDQTRQMPHLPESRTISLFAQNCNNIENPYAVYNINITNEFFWNILYIRAIARAKLHIWAIKWTISNRALF